jgi:hypothetical protein
LCLHTHYLVAALAVLCNLIFWVASPEDLPVVFAQMMRVTVVMLEDRLVEDHHCSAQRA